MIRSNFLNMRQPWQQWMHCMCFTYPNVSCDQNDSAVSSTCNCNPWPACKQVLWSPFKSVHACSNLLITWIKLSMCMNCCAICWGLRRTKKLWSLIFDEGHTCLLEKTKWEMENGLAKSLTLGILNHWCHAHHLCWGRQICNMARETFFRHHHWCTLSKWHLEGLEVVW